MSAEIDQPQQPSILDRLEISEVRVHPVRATYRRPFLISSGASHELTSLAVEIRDREGRSGYGEVSPMTAYTGETERGVRSAIEQHLAPALCAAPLGGITDAHGRMDACMRGQNLAKAGLDIALYDLIGRIYGAPVHTLLGGAVRQRVDVAWVVGLAGVDEMVAEAVESVRRGFVHIKVKGGVDPGADLVLVRELRSALPGSVELSLDANAGFRLGSALKPLERMAEAGLDIIEQPLPAWDLDGMASIRQRTGIRVMADESVHAPVDALAVVRHRAADIINIKVLKVGGLLPSLKVAAIAESAGLEIKIGSMPELGIATLAALHLAAASPIATIAADLVGPMMVRDEPLVPALAEAESRGWLPVPQSPGLGPIAQPWLPPQR